MKLFVLLLLVAAATAELERINSQGTGDDGDEFDSNAVLIRHVRTPPVLARGLLSFMTQKFVNKHVVNVGDMSFRHLRGKAWEENFERFALQKARNGYRRDDVPIRDALPNTLTIIETNAADRGKLSEEFRNRDTTSSKFITDDEFKVHTLTKNNNKFDYIETSQEKVEMGIDHNGNVNHFAGTVKCRNNGRRGSRQRRSVFRLKGKLCTRTWINPSPPESSLGTNSGTSGQSGTGNGQTGQTRPQRSCRRGYRRVAGRCVRQRRRQSG
ncbi:uncharacterized protein LOC135488968 [Lineus longissimus]|uniref:uncharacterized protein LOC135488968 n=1 Tax=Lineus longissimus TaxID=88925 RepID=UPI002B4C2617